jgi:transposase
MIDDKYVALDVHKATTTMTVVNARGEFVDRGVFQTSGELIVARVGSIPGRLRVTFEEGLHAAWLHDLLAPRVFQVLVCDPRKNALLASGSKNDRIDTAKLCELFRAGALSAVYHGDRSLHALQHLVRAYDTLVEDCTRTRSRLKMLYLGRAVACPGQTLYHPSRRQLWLEKLEDPGARRRAELLFEELDAQTGLRKQARGSLLAECRAHPEPMRILQSAPGFGPIRSAQLLAIVQTPHRFASRDRFSKYAGLKVEVRSSSDWEVGSRGELRRRRTKVSTRGLTKECSRRMKNIFKGAAQTASRTGPLVGYYRGLVDSGRKPEIARVILARRLAFAVLSMWKRGERFDVRRFLAAGGAADETTF